jgi:predicted ArsR family transcriptional regulator
VNTSPPHWELRFLGSTRGQVVALLRRARRTVDELAEALGLTDNAVRAHLSTLERDGLVAQHGVRRGERKPAVVYRMTPEAELLFPKAYGRILRELVAVVDARFGPAEADALAREVGRRLAAGFNPDGLSTEQRVALAVRILNDLGGLAEAAWPTADQAIVRGFACPLAEALPDQPVVCRMAESLLAEATALSVTEACDRTSGDPQCCFELTTRRAPSQP